MSELNLEKLADFKDAHEARVHGLASRNPDLLEQVAKMFDKLGCPRNALSTRMQAAYARAPRYVLTGVE
jgi:hypothetical protein